MWSLILKKRWMIFIVFILLIIWTAWGNTALELNTYKIKSEKLPERFDGFRIAQVSDLHNAQMGEDNAKLLEMLENAEPDLIAITGDFIDSRQTDVGVSLQFVKKAVEIAPCYYVTGNHESRLPNEEYLYFERKMEEYGVHILHNEAVVLEKEGERISLAGIDDPAFAGKNGRYHLSADWISGLYLKDGFQILLSHRPELFSTYVDANVDLVLSGHAHGGQFRLPFIGGLVAPNQGFFPEYDAGLFSKGNTNMIVSRGIGNSLFPFRVNNRPEVVLIEIYKKGPADLSF